MMKNGIKQVILFLASVSGFNLVILTSTFNIYIAMQALMRFTLQWIAMLLTLGFSIFASNGLSVMLGHLPTNTATLYLNIQFGIMGSILIVGVFFAVGRISNVRLMNGLIKRYDEKRKQIYTNM